MSSTGNNVGVIRYTKLKAKDMPNLAKSTNDAIASPVAGIKAIRNPPMAESAKLITKAFYPPTAL